MSIPKLIKLFFNIYIFSGFLYKKIDFTSIILWIEKKPIWGFVELTKLYKTPYNMPA